MNRFLGVIFFLTSIQCFSFQDKPRYVHFEEEVMVVIYNEQDSLMVEEYSRNEYYGKNNSGIKTSNRIAKEIEYYIDLKDFLDVWKISQNQLISVGSLRDINEKFEGKDIKLKGLEDQYFSLLEKNTAYSWFKNDDVFVRYPNENLRYTKLSFPGFDIMVLIDNREGIGWIYKDEKGAYNSWFGYFYSDLNGSYALSFEKSDKNYKLDNGKFPGVVKFEDNGQFGVYDVFLGKQLLPTVYDDVKLKNQIIVKKNSNYGLYDYTGKIVAPLEYKYIEYSSNRPYFIQKNNQASTITFEGDTLLASQINYDSFEPNYQKIGEYIKEGKYYYDEVKKNKSGFDRILHYKAENGLDSIVSSRVFETERSYEDFYFPNNKKIASNSLYNIIIGEREDGFFDVFYFQNISDPYVSLWVESVSSLNVKYDPLVCCDRRNHYFTLEKDGLEHFWWKNVGVRFKYDFLGKKFGPFYRFKLPDGRSGWLTKKGEVFDE